MFVELSAPGTCFDGWRIESNKWADEIRVPGRLEVHPGYTLHVVYDPDDLSPPPARTFRRTKRFTTDGLRIYELVT